MTLTTHGLIGAATASLFPAPYYPLAWSMAFVSHFFADAIPHWDYKTKSFTRNKDPLKNDFVINKKSVVDLTKIGIDFCLGIGLSYLLFPSHLYNPWLIVGGAFFGILPDPLQFAYWKIRREPLTTLQRLHISIHAKKKLEAWPSGIPIQLAILAIILLTTFFLHSFLSGLTTA